MANRRARLDTRVKGLRERYQVLDHLARAAHRYTEQRGSHFAAAITFYTILAVVPLVMIGFVVAGHVLTADDLLISATERGIASALPPELADDVTPIVNSAIAQGDTVAGLGLAVALYATVEWMANLREAVSAQWSLPAATRSHSTLKLMLSDLLALTGLAAVMIISIAALVVFPAPSSLGCRSWTRQTGSGYRPCSPHWVCWSGGPRAG